MANAKYDQTSTIMSGQDWVGGRIMAYLLEGAVYDKTHQTLNQAQAGAAQRNVTEILNRSVGSGGEALGRAAAFSVTPKGAPYQVILAWDRNQPEMSVLAFYDEDDAGGPIGLQNNGTLIVRPENYDPAVGVGAWFVF
jgi:hypothetical protein